MKDIASLILLQSLIYATNPISSEYGNDRITLVCNLYLTFSAKKNYVKEYNQWKAFQFNL